MALDLAASQARFTSTTAPNVTAPPFTMSVWVYIDSFLTNRPILDISDTAYTTSFNINTSTTSQIQFIARTSSTNTNINYASATTGTWIHVCAVARSATDRELFIDGTSVGTSTVSRNGGTMNSINIGFRSGATANTLDGKVAEVAIWNNDLTTPEIISLAKGVPPFRVRPNNLDFYFPAIREEDEVVGGYSMTKTGTVNAYEHPRRIG